MIVPEDGQSYGGVVLDITHGRANTSDCKSSGYKLPDCKSGRAGANVLQYGMKRIASDSLSNRDEVKTG